MKMKLLLSAVLVAAFAGPAAADFWIVQDQASKRCSIVEQKPTAATMMVLAGEKAFKTRNEAEDALKNEAACK